MDFGDFLSGVGGIFDGIYNLATNKRDFDYQKALQKTIFEREDTAVQRRMADLQAAGINPNLAAGSAASAGSVVGRSETPKSNLGSSLDMIAALNQIKLQKQEQQNKAVENNILKAQASSAWNDNAIKQFDLINNLGWKGSVKPYFDDDGTLHWEFTYDGDSKAFKDTPYYKGYQAQINSMQNSAEYLQRELNWFTSDQIRNWIGTIGSVAPIPRFNIGYNHRR